MTHFGHTWKKKTNQQSTFLVAESLRCRGATPWPTVWCLRRCALRSVWTAARRASLARRPSPKTRWTTSWASTCPSWRSTAWVKAPVRTPSPATWSTASRGQRHTVHRTADCLMLRRAFCCKWSPRLYPTVPDFSTVLFFFRGSGSFLMCLCNTTKHSLWKLWHCKHLQLDSAC